MSGRLARDSFPPIARRRVVLLGASNLAKGLGTALETARRVCGGPIELLAAMGHGRSYGRSTTVLGRQLPGIVECGLWDDLSPRLHSSTTALVTDIGNDLLYGEPVERIADWLATCLDRLQAAGAQTVITRLPVENLDRLSAGRFRLLRTLFYPRCRLSLDEAAHLARALDAQVQALAAQRSLALVAPRAAWYGFDPIHIRFAERPLAWREMIAGGSPGSVEIAPAAGSLARGLALRMRSPHRRRLFGVEQRRAQPMARLRCGTTIALY